MFQWHTLFEHYHRKLNLDFTSRAHLPILCIPTTWRIYDYMEMIYMVRCERSNITRAEVHSFVFLLLL